MENIAIRQVSPNSAKKSIIRAFKKQRPIFIWGPPGIGKSDIVSQITDTFEQSHLIDVRLSLWEPTDVKGMPYYSANDNTMKWAPPVELPDAKMAKKYKTIVLFLDEMNSAAPSVQAAAYQLILNRKVGTYELPENVVIVAAGNREADKGITYRMPAPLANRFIHLEMKPAFDDWFEWAVDNKIHKELIKDLNKQFDQLSKKNILSDKSKNIIKDETINKIKVRFQKIIDLPPKDLRKLVDSGKKEIKNGIIIVFASKEDKVGLAVGVTDKLIDKYDAVKFAKIGSEIIGGKGGGGRKDFAQAGGLDASKIEEAFDKLKSLV